MTKFFCAEASRQADEDMIGSGTPYEIYVLIEHPTPWASEALDSSGICEKLKQLIEQTRQENRSIRFLLITRERRGEINQRTVLIYKRQHSEWIDRYIKYEFQVDKIEEIAAITQTHLNSTKNSENLQNSVTRDILVCTHGSHDKCCAKYGLPFYREALAVIRETGLPQVRLWKTSHFGGHRFAPTIIDLPEGRYYGRLDASSFRTLLTRTGDLEFFNQTYRGWSILPTPMQVLERELFFLYGWEWLKYQVTAYQLQNRANGSYYAELLFCKLDGVTCRCQAELVPDEGRSLHLKGSCTAAQESRFVKYAIAKLDLSICPPIYAA